MLRHRHLEQVEQRVEVLLFLQLYYVNSGLALQIEKSIARPFPSNVVAAHFCNAVNAQVSFGLSYVVKVGKTLAHNDFYYIVSGKWHPGATKRQPLQR